MKCPHCKREVNQRSTSQNSFYWMYLGIIERETGNIANSLHEYFRRTLLTPKHIKVMGKEIKIPTSTTELSKVEMGEYMDKISAETEVAIPDPHDAGFMCMKKGCVRCNEEIKKNTPVWRK